MTPRSGQLICSQAGIDQIVQFEISSPQYYVARLQRPTWPGHASGVTIGIGYDLGHTSRNQIIQDWSPHVARQVRDQLLGTQGIKGATAKPHAAKLREIKIPLAVARQVFQDSTLPRFAAITRRAYPGTEHLPPDAQAMILSLVFNRGASKTGATRTEMKALEPLIKRGDLRGIANQIRAMKRLWNPQTLRGLHIRRDREAAMIESSDRPYRSEELVLI